VPDVVLLDLSLPGRDGLEVLADARRRRPDTPVLILTARGTVGDRILGLNSGADDYLPKPFDLDELEAACAPWPGALQAAPERRASALLRPAHRPRQRRRLPARRALDLAPRELALLRALLARPGQAVAASACSSWYSRAMPRCRPMRSRSWPTACARRSRHRCTAGHAARPGLPAEGRR
jgi:two-component system, OmpR family, response regulator TctD